MKHHKSIRKFGRKTGQRNALVASLAYSLVLKRKIVTTEAKAKELRPFIEKLVTKGKTDTIATRRLLTARIGEEAAAVLVKDIAPQYKERNGGYTRIIKLPRRAGDASKMAEIQFV
jgi:large subunit ribosomal protein L17